MKGIFTYCLLTIVFCISNLYAQNQLIANYTLQTNAEDSTGNNADMILTNTVFQNNSLYSDGNYNTTNAITPHLSAMNMNSFTISCQFNINEVPSNAEGMPIFMGGDGYRWMGMWITDAQEIGISANNDVTWSGSLIVPLDQWNEGKIVYEGSSGDAKLYLNDSLALTRNVQLNHGDNKNIGLTDFGGGFTFKGHIRNLKIYSNPPLITNINKIEESISFQFYPQPASSSAELKYSLPNTSANAYLVVYDLLGKELSKISLSTFSNEIIIDLTNFKTGRYLCNIKTEKGISHYQRLQIYKN